MRNSAVHERPAAHSVIHPFFDFWLLGGASVALWLLMTFSDYFRTPEGPVDQRFLQVGASFALLSLICNHPHFVMSYQLGYGRGIKFIRNNWVALVAVPVGLVALFIASFMSTEKIAVSGPVVDSLNAAFESLGLSFRFGLQGRQSDELMGIALYLMYLTVGWHYAKQVFGCMMIYGQYDGYKTSATQRLILKGSLFSIAVLQFAWFFQARSSGGSSVGFPATSVSGQVLPSPLTPLGLPEELFFVAAISTATFFLASIIFVILKNRKDRGQWPSSCFLISWIAFHVWWVPLFFQPEFTFLMVPFFHSLQYLPFAYRVGTPKFKKDHRYYTKISIHVAIILLIGFFAFEGLPQSLDTYFDTASRHQPLFFVTAFAVFINIHHFFIDSVTWKMSDKNLRSALLEGT